MNGRLVWAVVALVVSAGVLGVPLAAGGKQPKCLIVNTRVDASFATLQAANDASSTRAGDALVVKGTCTGITTVTKNVTITGKSNPGFGPATLDGNQLGSVVTITSGVQVAISNLTITHGTGSIPVNQSFRLGGGIRNYGLLALTGVSIIGNAAYTGGGVWTKGDLTLDHSSIRGNTAQGAGGESTFPWSCRRPARSSPSPTARSRGIPPPAPEAGSVSMREVPSRLRAAA